MDIVLEGLRLMAGDCLERMAGIPDGSIDMVLADPPYGTTQCKWDSVIPFEPMWAHLKRIAKPNAAIVMTASQPFTSALVMSNPGVFKYCWVWEKTKGSNFLNARKQPLRYTEDVVVFCQGVTPYNPQMTTGHAPTRSGICVKPVKAGIYGEEIIDTITARSKGTTDRFPRNIIKLAGVDYLQGIVHPTQKPVALMEYLIKTYTDPGETVLDFTMGSGTTGVAARRLKRQFIGIEKDPTYYGVACGRILNEVG